MLLSKFIIKAKLKHHSIYDYSIVEYINNKTKIKIICNNHGIFEQRPDSHLRGFGCSKCTKEPINKLTISNVERRTNNSNYDFTESKYINIDTQIEVKCLLHNELFKIVPKNLFRGWGCSLCSGKILNNSIFIEKANSIHNNRYDYSLLLYKNSRSNIKIICNEHGEFEQLPNNHLKGIGCNKCAIKYRTNSLCEFIDKSALIHDNKYDYSLVCKDYINGNSIVNILCPSHNIFTQTAVSHLTGKGCPVCKESKGERKIANFLNKRNIHFERFKKFATCKHINRLIFDFWLPDQNILIEFDGKQHYESIDFFGGEKRLKDQIIKDNIKDEWCKSNNILLLRLNNILNIEYSITSILK